METPFQQPMQTGLQFSSFNPYAQQQQQMQDEWMRQQQMAELQRQVRSIFRHSSEAKRY